MGKVEHIEQQIRELSGDEFTELRDWLMDLDWRLWDAKFEADVHAGKLDALGKAARRAHAQGKTHRNSGPTIEPCPLKCALLLIVIEREHNTGR